MKLFKAKFKDVTSDIEKELKSDVKGRVYKLQEVQDTFIELPDVFIEEDSYTRIQLSDFYLDTEKSLTKAYLSLFERDNSEALLLFRIDWRDGIFYFSVKEDINPFHLSNVLFR